MRALTALALAAALAAPAAGAQTGVFVSPFMKIPMLSLQMEPGDDAEAQGDGLDYETRVTPDVGLALEVGAFGVSFSVPLGGGDDPEDPRGRTSYRDLKLDWFRGMWGLELGAHEYVGFHRQLEGDDAYERRGDLAKTGRYVNAYFIPFGDLIGVGSRIHQLEIRGVAWSPVVQLGYDYARLKASSGLVGADQFSLYGSEAGMTDGRFESYVLSGGAAAKYGKERWQLFTMLLFGRSVQNHRLEVDGATRDDWTLGERMSLRFGLETLWDRWILGTSLMMDQTSLELGPSQIESTVGSVMVSLGTDVLTL